MERQRPDTTSNELDLYIRTYYSLLRSSGEIRVRAFEEAHTYSQSSLHAGARDVTPDISAFGYSAARLPECMDEVRRVVLGQAADQFEPVVGAVKTWQRVSARGRRRPMRYDGNGTLAVIIASYSDIDDLVPMVTAYQLEWNKMHSLLANSTLADELKQGTTSIDDPHFDARLAETLTLDLAGAQRLRAAFGARMQQALQAMVSTRLDLRMQLVAGSLSHYQRAANRWWTGIEPIYLSSGNELRRRPVYFVSSNTHSLANLLGGHALAHKDAILETARREDPDHVLPELERALAEGAPDAANLLYFCLREHLHRVPGALDEVQKWDAASGIVTVPNPGHIEVSAQVVEMRSLLPERFDPRVTMPGLERLWASDAVIVNIDYPLGMAAYQLLARVGQGVGSLRGVYVMGKAATLNGRVGDVMVSKVVQDEHSHNTYIFQNAFQASDLAPYLRYGTVLDNQKALTVRSAFLQNADYMSTFYREGYTVLEMEAGPYLSAVFELVDPRRHPTDELVYLGERPPFELGLLHYASDTPYSRRQSLVSKSLSFFGMDSTYACAIAIVRRILKQELTRLAQV